MQLDAIKILDHLTAEFGSGEVSIARHEWNTTIELLLVVGQRRALHAFTVAEYEASSPEVFNRIYNQMFKMLVRDIKEYGS